MRWNQRMRKKVPLLILLALATFAFYYWGKSINQNSTTKTPTVKTDATVAIAAATAWPQAHSDIAADEKTVFGNLPNGFRYMIYPNAEPPKRYSVRLHIATGSLMEADDQQGVAHFLEHMVFNGSKNFTPDELVPRMQRLGIGFGAHVNAYTSFDETVYMLDLPDMSKETMQLAYTVMRDFADGALLKPDEIDKERGVILSEKLSRDSVNFRMMQKQFSQLLPDSLIPKRFPIGTEAVIKAAPRERFVDYYTRFYTPQRMTFIVVGDVDAEATKAMITGAFSSLKNPQTPGVNPDLGKVEPLAEVVPAVFTDKELTKTELTITTLSPYVKQPDTSAVRASRMPLELAHAMLNRRFERLAKAEGAAIIAGGASRSVIFNFTEVGSVEVTAKDDDWKKALPVLDQEFRRALEFGFTDDELTEAVANALNAYEQQVKSAATRKSNELATAIARSINDDSVFSSPQTDLDIAKKALEKITVAHCQEAFNTFWKKPGYHLILSTKDAAEGVKDELASLYRESAKTKVAAPEMRKTAAFGYTEFAAPGTIAKRDEVADLGITQLTLSNGIKVNLKSTDFTKNSIDMLARFGTGLLMMPKDKPGLQLLAGAVFNGGGLGKHSVDELQQILAGKNVGADLALSEDAFLLQGKTTPQDLELQLQLLCAAMTDPGYRDEALRQFKAALPMIDQQLKHSPAGPKEEIEAWMHGDDPRFAMPDVAKLATYTVDDVKAWLAPELAQAPLELSIVGDFQIDTLIPLLLKTVGSLPARAAASADLAPLRKVTMPTAPVSKNLSYDSKVPQAIVICNWKTRGLRDNQKEARRMNVLAAILSDRLRMEIREKLGASYSPNAGFDGSDALDDFGYVSAMSVGKPEDLGKLTETITTIADKFAAEGATADELDRALKPTLASIEKTLRDNTYWLATVMKNCQEKPASLEFARNRTADYESIKLEEINALAKSFLKKDNAISINIQSKAAP